MKTRGILTAIAVLIFGLMPLQASAQSTLQQPVETTFQARVIEVLQEAETVREDGSISVQQKLLLQALGGEIQGEEFTYDGTVYDDISASTYEVGDRVVVLRSQLTDGSDSFYVTGIVRSTAIYWLALIFALIVVFVGRWKGLRALLVLGLTFAVILKFMLPRILAGADPLWISLLGSLIILVVAIYITEGFKKTSTISISAVTISLLITGLLSVWFTYLTQLTGFATEESTLLVGFVDQAINMRGLLLAGIIIGALGVLDDIVVSQVALVEELKTNQPQKTRSEIYSQAMRVGVSHLSSMINTLFLAYAGASLPLLLMFAVPNMSGIGFSEIINNEVIATEIVRTLTGSVGLVLSVPIATVLAVRFADSKKS